MKSADILGTVFSQHERCADTYFKAGLVLSSASATPGGIVAFMDYITFPEASSTTIDVDMAERAHDLFRKSAAAAQKWEHNLLEAKGNVLPALAKQIDALFEAGLCGLCSSNGLAQRALEAATTIRDRYERFDKRPENSLKADDGLKSGSSTQSLLERGNFLVNMGDLSFHLGHSYVRAGKLQYAVEEATSALSYYDNPSVDKGTSVLRRRMTLGLRALTHTMRGAIEDAEDDLRELESTFQGPVEDGSKEMANVRAMIARRARRGGLNDSSIYSDLKSSGSVEKKPVPVVAAAKPPTALQEILRASYRTTTRGLDRFLSFITGEHWTSVLAAWLLILLSLASVAFLASGLLYQAIHHDREL